MGAHQHGAHAHDSHPVPHPAPLSEPHDPAPTDPIAFWEQRYGSADRVWSGSVNRTLADLAEGWTPGRALDLGSGEGGDVHWLAERGWDATGIDLSSTAVARAQLAAAERRLEGAHFIAADLGRWSEDPAAIDGGAAPFDLVTASFFQSPVELPRERILRAAADRVAPGGRLVLIAHAAAPQWSSHHDEDFPTPETELAALELAEDAWEVAVAEVRERDGRGPDGTQHRLSDSVVVARRR
ncbi:class I SAM-dependent methyltransferase [Leucobacter sp. NPDC077196]|uniref:class I SAM-dependent methyltransferase n=1 Tax=Leucobacter sp. NPDC077196 TaxID=3154959 RepID=UPI003422C1B7